jgi:hypothetical protein
MTDDGSFPKEEASPRDDGTASDNQILSEVLSALQQRLGGRKGVQGLQKDHGLAKRLPYPDTKRRRIKKQEMT